MPHDPKLTSELQGTVNGRILDRTIRHAHYIERLKTSETNRILTMLNRDVYPNLLNEIERRLTNIASTGPTVSLSSTNRLIQLRKAIDNILRVGYSDAYAIAKGSLVEIANMEAIWNQKVILGSIPTGIRIQTELPSKATLRSIVTSRPWEGRFVRDLYRGLERSTRNKVRAAVNSGLVRGSPIDEIVRSLKGTRQLNYTDGILNQSRRDVRTIVRTSVNHVTTQAREATYEANSDIISSVQYVATLDSKTTDICQSLDGKIFPINEGERPPMHHQCRSTTVPVIKSWKELGIDLNEAPPGTRESMDGQVPESLTYGKWLKGQPASVQNDALGPGRAKLFREKNVPVDRFVDNQHRPLTLAQIIQREGIEAVSR